MSSDHLCSFQKQLNEEIQNRGLPNETQFTNSMFDAVRNSLEIELKSLAAQNKEIQRNLCVQLFDKIFSAFYSSITNVETKNYPAIDNYNSAMDKLLDESKLKDANDQSQYDADKVKIDGDIWLEVKERFDHLLVCFWQFGPFFH